MASTAPDPVFTFRGHESTITALSFYKENELISGSETGEIIIWDLVSKRMKSRWVLDTFGQPYNTILYIGCLGGPFITQSRNGYINLWVKGDNGRFVAEKSYESNNLSFCKASLCTLKNHTQPAKVESLLAFPTREDSALFILLNINTGEMNMFVDTNSKTKELGQIMCSKVFNHPTHGDPKIIDLRLLTGHEVGRLVMWKFCADIRECYAECEVDLFNQDPIICLEMEHLKFNKFNNLTGEDSQEEVPELPFHGISGSVNNKLITFEIVRGVLLKGMELELKDRFTNVVTLRRCENNRIKPIICAAGKDGRLRILSWKTFNFLAILKFHSDSVICAVFCPKSGLLAAGSRDLRITLWSVYQE